MLGGKIRLTGARGKGAGALALAGIAVLGYVFLQPTGLADIPGWEPVNAQLAEALGEASGSAKPSETGAALQAKPDSSSVSGQALGAASSTGSAAAEGAPAGQTSSGGLGANGNAGAPASASGASPGVQPPSPAADVGASLVADASGKLNLNTATADQLDALKGIGPSKAQAIVAYREQKGPFHSIDDLLNVKGIGPKLLEGIREQVTV